MLSVYIFTKHMPLIADFFLKSRSIQTYMSIFVTHINVNQNNSNLSIAVYQTTYICFKFALHDEYGQYMRVVSIRNEQISNAPKSKRYTPTIVSLLTGLMVEVAINSPDFPFFWVSRCKTIHDTKNVWADVETVFGKSCNLEYCRRVEWKTRTSKLNVVSDSLLSWPRKKL